MSKSNKKYIVTFSRSYEVTQKIVDQTEAKGILLKTDADVAEGVARYQFDMEFYMLNASADNFSTTVKISE